MLARLVSLISGAMIIMSFLSLQLVAGCNSIDKNTSAIVSATILNTPDLVEILGNQMLEKITIASIAIVAISLLVLIVDKHLDNPTVNGKKS